MWSAFWSKYIPPILSFSALTYHKVYKAELIFTKPLYPQRLKIIIKHKQTTYTILYINIYFLMSSTCFETRGFILRETVIYMRYDVWYIHRCEQSGV